MRNPQERDIALECLRLAVAHDTARRVEVAERYLAFVLGTEIDEAKARIEAVREAIS